MRFLLVLEGWGHERVWAVRAVGIQLFRKCGELASFFLLIFWREELQAKLVPAINTLWHLGLLFGVRVGLRLETNMDPNPTGNSCNPWKIILKKLRVFFPFPVY